MTTSNSRNRRSEHNATQRLPASRSCSSSEVGAPAERRSARMRLQHGHSRPIARSMTPAPSPHSVTDECRLDQVVVWQITVQRTRETSASSSARARYADVERTWLVGRSSGSKERANERYSLPLSAAQTRRKAIEKAARQAMTPASSKRRASCAPSTNQVARDDGSLLRAER